MNNLRKIFRGRVHYIPVLKILSSFNRDIKVLEAGAQDEVLKELLPKNISYKTIDMYGNPDYKIDLNSQKIPAKDNSFDVLVCLETLEHTLYPKKILEEFKRVTKKDGLLILSMPNEYNFWLRFLYLFAIKPALTDEPFEIVTKFQHIQKPRVKDDLKLFSDYFKILKVRYIWQSRLGNISDFFYSFDRFINFLAQFFPTIFARQVMVVAKNRKDDSTQKNK
jgi:SAM-dependent methyltransferase